MHVRSDRRHSFSAPLDEVWAAVLEVDRYSSWWPWLRTFEADRLAEGEEWRCVVQPPLPYSVRFTISIVEVVPSVLVRAAIGGDIEGEARVEFAASAEGGTDARLRADLEPAHLAFKAIGFAAGPLVRLAHDWVLDTGARQFRDRALGPVA